MDTENVYIAPGTGVRLISGLEVYVNKILISARGVEYKVWWQDEGSLRTEWVFPWMIGELINPDSKCMHSFTLRGC